MERQTNLAIMSVILLIVGFAVAGLLYTFTTVLSGQTYNIVEDDLDSITSYTVTDSNDTITLVNGTWNALGNSSISPSNYNAYVAANATSVKSLVTWNLTDGTIFLDNTTTWVANGTSVYSVYTYDDGTILAAIKSGILSNFEAQQQIGDYVPIIALAIIITIIIGLIMGGIASRFMTPTMGFGQQGGYGGVL